MRRFRRIALSFMLRGALIATAACAARQPSSPAGSVVELPAQPEPPTATAQEPSIATMSEEEATLVTTTLDAGSSDLPLAWTRGPAQKPIPIATAMTNATTSRKNFDAVMASLPDAGAPSASTFGRGASFVDYTSRLYASAFYAFDATPAQKVDALQAAAEMELAWSRRLDELGLEKMPESWRTDPSLALTWEDMTTGPVKRWRKEGLALVDLCVATARETKIDTPSARSCLAMRRNVSRVVLPRETKNAKDARSDAGSATNSGCVCDRGDPLCSATMNGWCGPAR